MVGNDVKRDGRRRTVTLFLCGDVMTGRGIDQALPCPGDPWIPEPMLGDSREYIRLAEEAHGPIPRPIDFAGIWGDALQVLRAAAPDLRLVNLETSITRTHRPWPDKGINYRMSPENAACLKAADIDGCVLANNHVLDWDYAGLEETLETLSRLTIQWAGAGRDFEEAQRPSVFDVPDRGRILVWGMGSEDSGIPPAWAATETRPGVNVLPDFSESTVARICEAVAQRKQAGDIAVASIHWGGNWGYAIPQDHRRFARRLIDEAGVDVIHGHSSHHVKGFEVYRDRLVLYGCGDFLTDYEGIKGYEAFRDDLGLMYFPEIDPATGRLVSLEMQPTRLRGFRVSRASREEAEWMRDVLNREGRPFGTAVERDERNRLRWLT